MKTLIELDVCNINQHLLPSLINGDDSALSAQEEHQCEQFLSAYTDTEGPLIFEPVLKDSFFGKCEVIGSYGDVVEVKVFGYKDIESLPDMCERIGSMLPNYIGVKRDEMTDRLVRAYLKKMRKGYDNYEKKFEGAESGSDEEQAGLMGMERLMGYIKFAESHLPENRVTIMELIESEKF
tara:strand:+ start:1689 stop:2228 length:540 start_codon:yes stop_codon:yes gene_type:complete